MPGTLDLYSIWKSGSCPLVELPGLVRAFTQPEDKAVAFYVDHFQAANCGYVEKLLEKVETLLELRIFREEAEFWAHRTGLGAEFSWRIADDCALWEKSGEADFDAVRKRYIIETRQLLDISPEYGPYRNGETDNFGCRELRSSVGGHYSLPFDDEKDYGYVKIVNYVSYNQDGIAGITDFRIAGFEPLPGKEASDDETGSQPV